MRNETRVQYHFEIQKHPELFNAHNGLANMRSVLSCPRLEILEEANHKKRLTVSQSQGEKLPMELQYRTKHLYLEGPPKFLIV
jgi:hypothetical protein